MTLAPDTDQIVCLMDIALKAAKARADGHAADGAPFTAYLTLMAAAEAMRCTMLPDEYATNIIMQTRGFRMIADAAYAACMTIDTEVARQMGQPQ